ncbi:MAG TPA: hypothetical protein PLA94_18005, partial [Myxococcota bacterium]|nr:hypothetical protein [Myxococcota bacterium]
MRKVLPVIPALLALSYSPAASALGRGVLWYESTSYGTTLNSTQQAALLAAGATSFTDTTTWPSSLSAYRVIFVVMPTTSMSASQISDLNSFTASGGIVVLVGEAVGYYTAGVSYLNSIASGMGLSSSFTSSSVDSGCSWTATRQSTTPVLTASSPSLIYAYGTNISRGGSATTL